MSTKPGELHLGHKSRYASFLDYERGLMLPIERKSVEPIAAHVDPDNVSSAYQSVHHFVSTSPWSDRKLLDAMTEHVLEVMDCSEDVYLMIDDTGLPKKGTHSVGVSHQYCGQLGKQANCQVAVSLSLANTEGSVPVDYQLYLPKAWACGMDSRAAVGVPEEIEFQTEPDIALAQISAAYSRNLPRGIVLADTGYGNDISFREGIEALELMYSVGVQSTTSVWAPGVEPLPPKPWSERGRRPYNMQIAKGHAPVSCQALASELPSGSWRYIKWREGPIRFYDHALLRYEFVSLIVINGVRSFEMSNGC